MQITDAGLVILRPLKQLRWLNPGFTQISSAGLPTLQEFSQLEELDLRGTEISIDDAEELEEAPPNCKVVVGMGNGPRRPHQLP